jgi:rSAM/selenodomain-associated transferase 2
MLNKYATARLDLKSRLARRGDESALPDRISIIVPILNERAILPQLLVELERHQRSGCEVILVDGGSHDGSPELARESGFAALTSPPGRARQMNTGARCAHGDVLLFLHADTRLPAEAVAFIRRAFADESRTWGFFAVQIEGSSPLLRAIAFLINHRSRLTSIATGDQAIFVRRTAFERLAGFPEQPLMEDVELSRRLKRTARPICMRARVATSGRRWEARGIWRTIILMWTLRFAYWVGVRAENLAKLYR